MKDHNKKEPLYRKEKLARNMHRQSGGDFRHDRNTKEQKMLEDVGETRYPMRGKNRGYDYTPLLKFLLSKVGKKWVEVHQEAVSRLDREEPIFWMVARNEDEKEEVVNISENSYYSGLYVDEQGLLQKVNPDFQFSESRIRCTCCTYSFNGVAIKKNLKEKVE